MEETESGTTSTVVHGPSGRDSLAVPARQSSRNANLIGEEDNACADFGRWAMKNEARHYVMDLPAFLKTGKMTDLAHAITEELTRRGHRDLALRRRCDGRDGCIYFRGNCRYGGCPATCAVECLAVQNILQIHFRMLRDHTCDHVGPRDVMVSSLRAAAKAQLEAHGRNLKGPQLMEYLRKSVGEVKLTARQVTNFRYRELAKQTPPKPRVGEITVSDLLHAVQPYRGEMTETSRALHVLPDSTYRGYPCVLFTSGYWVK